MKHPILFVLAILIGVVILLVPEPLEPAGLGFLYLAFTQFI